MMWRFAIFLTLIAVEASAVVAEKPRDTDSDAQAVSAKIDALLETRLSEAGIALSIQASDGEFLRRAMLDITGRIPTYDEAATFLADTSANKRSQLINTLLARDTYGEFFAAVWRERLAPPEIGSKKQGRDLFSPWLATQFNQNQGWNKIVTQLLTVEGRIREQPQSAFIVANSEKFDPQPNLLADATSRLFWGVQLRCAECHDHPFAPWKQEQFWGTAAFFSRVRRGYALGKNPEGWTITEAPPDQPVDQKFTHLTAAEDVPGPAIVVSSDGAKLQGRTVKGAFLGEDPVNWTDHGPFRARFAEWATGKHHPYFAASTANRWWAHFFGRGLVNPLDGFQPDNTPSHPEVLELLTHELISTDFDLKHLIRVICHTRAYQRSSRPVVENVQDEILYSHMAVKPMRPEMLYDALSIALFQPQPKPGAKQAAFTPPVQPLPGLARDEFLRFFRSRDDARESSQVNHGIPQLLRLLNGSLLNEHHQAVDQFMKQDLNSTEMIDALYLSAYTRLPSNAERDRILEFKAQYPDENLAWPAVYWALLNSSEFALNH